MRREDLISVLATSTQWTEDRWGSFKRNETETVGKDITGVPMIREIRLKLNKNAVRLEGKIYGQDWMNIRSDYYSNCRIEGKNVIIGGRKIDIS